MSKATREVRLVGGMFHGNTVRVVEGSQMHSEIRENSSQRIVHTYIDTGDKDVFYFFRTFTESKQD